MKTLPSSITKLVCDKLNHVWFGCGDGTVGCWSVTDDKLLFSAKAHTRGVTALAATRIHIWAFGDDKKVSIYLQSTKTHLKTVDLPFRTLCATPDQDNVVVGTTNGIIAKYAWVRVCVCVCVCVSFDIKFNNLPYIFDRIQAT